MNTTSKLEASMVSFHVILRLFTFTFLILLSQANARTRFSTTTITSTFNSDAQVLKTISTSFEGAKKSYGFVYEVNVLHDIVLHSIDLHTDTAIIESLQVRLKSGSSDNFNSSTSSWTLVSNATNIIGEKIETGYRASIPMKDFIPTPLFKGNLYSIYVTLSTPSLLSTIDSSNTQILAEDESSLQIQRGSIVARHPSTVTREGYAWDGAIKYKLKKTPEPSLQPSVTPTTQPSIKIPSQITTEKPTMKPTGNPSKSPQEDEFEPMGMVVKYEYTSTKTIISFSYKPPFIPMEDRGKSKIDESLTALLNENLETNRIQIVNLESIFTEDPESCRDCYRITSVATVKHEDSISSNNAKEMVSSLGPVITNDIPNLNYTLPKLLNANLLFILQGSSELAEYQLETEKVEEEFLLLFEEVMIDFLNTRLISMAPPAHIISVKVRDPNILEESSAKMRLRSTNVQAQELNDISISTEYMYNLDTIITGEFILFSEEYFERLIHDVSSDYANSFVRMLDQKLKESGIPVKVDKMKSIQSSYIGEDEEKRSNEKKRYWLYFFTIIISFLVYSVKCPGS